MHARSAPGAGRAGGAGALAGAVGSWKLGVKGALCATGGPANRTNPDAWFGGAGPLVYAPGTNVNLDAGASTAAVSDDPTNYPAPSISYAGIPAAPTASPAPIRRARPRP